MFSYNAGMPRLIAFVFCIAFLVGAGASVPVGMGIAAAAVLGLVVFLAWSLLQMFFGPVR